MDSAITKPFLYASLIWLVLGGVICGFRLESSPELWVGMAWFAMLWALCLLDLFAIARVVWALLSFAGGSVENRGALAIQTFFWGSIKLACLGIFIFAFTKGHSMASASAGFQSGLLVGLGTLVVIPLFGGYWWSQRALSHA